MAHIAGILYWTSGSLFAEVFSSGSNAGAIETSADLDIWASPLVLGTLIDPTHRVYCGGSDGTIYKFGPRLDPVPPNPIAVPSTFSLGQAMTGASLADADGVLYVGTGTDVTPEGQGSMWALDDATGHVRWETDMGGCVQYPASIAIENRRPFRVIAGTSAAPSIQGLNPATGEQIWSEEDLCFGQTVHGDVVYYADLSSQSIRARSVVNGKLLWQYVNDDFNFNRPVVAGNVVYATNLGSRVYAFDALRGTVLWEVSLEHPFPGVPILFDNTYDHIERLIFAGGEFSVGNVFMVALDPRSGALVWTSNSLDTGEGERVTEPVLFGGGGDVIVGTMDGRLLGVDPATGALWPVRSTATSIMSSPGYATF